MMNFLIKVFKHFKTICTHRSAVFYFGRRLGIGWRALFHDLSKFHPIEFFESVEYYSGTRSPIDACKEAARYSRAWLHHKGKNPHHYEYWVDNFDRGGIPIDMPLEYKLEMLCDYLAAGYTYSNKTCTFHDEYIWWINKSKFPLLMHVDTRKFLDKVFEYLDKSFGAYRLNSLSNECWKVIHSTILDVIKQ